MMERPGVISVPNETNSSTTRLTREGKNLRYELKVLQQPQRARACGSGMKSSADRRPVDPPPIVQLKVLELKPNDVAEDITFTMNANYFLFATLEPSRHMAQARGMPEANKPTVLTGTPVAGMVYLERPESAGYFIFPDLSVRHEGHFRLSFSLYEELKRTEDYDKTDDSGRASSPADTHVTHRLEVKSEPLQVFSAKKFPGLTSSTNLSRVVAEQGCRVRIRREARMRKPSSKPGKEWDEYEDETASQRAKASGVSDVPYAYQSAPLGAPPPAIEPIGRPRSASNASHQSLGAPISRRQSQQDMAQAYYQQQSYGATAPHTPQSGVIPASASTYGPSPTQQYSQPPYMQQQPIQPPPPHYQQQGYPPAPVQPQQPSYQSYQPPPPPPQPQYAQEGHGHGYRPSGDWSSAPIHPEYHRPSVSHVPQPVQPQTVHTPQPAPLPYNPHSYKQAPQPYHAQQPQQPSYYAPIEAQSSRAPPPEPIQPPTRTTAPTPPLSAKPFSYTLPPISHALEPSSPAVATPTNTSSFFPGSSSSQAPAAETHKRSYGSTFSTAHHDVAQKAGARPDSYAHSISSNYPQLDADDDIADFGDMTGAYKRANGAMAVARHY